MGNPYNSQSISGYNATPPPDDASQTAANQVSWAKHKAKLGDPVKTLSEGINTEVLAAFGKLPWYTSRTISSNDTVVALDERKVLSCSNSITLTLLAAADAGNGFTTTVFNADSGTITIDGDGSETINGALIFTLNSQYDSVHLFCDGTSWTAIAEKVASALPPEHINGLTFSNNVSDSDHDIDIAVGSCRDAADAADISITSAIGKQIDVSWATGGTPATPTGGLSSSLTLAADTIYYVHAILVGGTAEVGIDTSDVAANLITDHSATAYRLIAVIETDTSLNIINDQFTQIVLGGEEYSYPTPATTSGTAFDFRAIRNAKQIIVSFQGVSLSGTDDLLVQIGDSGGVQTTGYISSAVRINAGPNIVSSTAGFNVFMQEAAAIFSGHMLLTHMGGNLWASSHSGKKTTGNTNQGGGDKTLSGTLDRVRITRTGTDTFDAGSVTIKVE